MQFLCAGVRSQCYSETKPDVKYVNLTRVIPAAGRQKRTTYSTDVSAPWRTATHHQWRRLDVGDPVQLVLVDGDLARETSARPMFADDVRLERRARHHLLRVDCVWRGILASWREQFYLGVPGALWPR